jgi:hypothetical protein
MMADQTPDCPYTGERDLAQLYLAGRLPDAEAQAFEAHYFECEVCSQDVLGGGGLRELFGRPAVAAAVAPARPARAWLPLAAAAAIAFVGIGVWQLARRVQVEPTVLRSAGAVIVDLKVSAHAGGGFDVSWAPQPQAATYEVQVFASDSTRLWRTETREPRVSIGPTVLSAPAPGSTYEIRVEAFDSLGQIVASAEVAAARNP